MADSSMQNTAVAALDAPQEGGAAQDLGRAGRIGLWALGIAFVGFLIWAIFAPLDEGVPSTGTVALDTKRKAVQHLSGGIVKQVLVREGDEVQADQVLMRLDEIAALKAEVAGGRNPKDAKVALAKEITARFHSAAAADAAEQDFINRSKGGVPDDIPDVALSGAPLGIGALLKQANLAPSTSEANRLIDGGGVRVDGGVVSDKGLKLEAGTYVVQVGKRKFARVTLG